MSIKRYIADADNTITNAFKASLTTRGTGSNMGASDVLEVFSIYGQVSSSAPVGYTEELARILIRFPIDDIATDRTNKNIPASGNVSFFLRMFNAKHSFTLPTDMKLVVTPVKQYWEEGFGLDMEEYTDLTYDGSGSNWLRRATSSAGTLSWDRLGGDYYDHDSLATSYTVNFAHGWEDMEVDISGLVEQWIATNVAATATITITDYTELNTGDKVNLIATDGTNYDFTNGDQSSVNGTWESATSNDQTATNLMNVINTSSGPAGTRFTATVEGAVVTVTQATAGDGGNTTVTLTDSGTAGMSKTNFTGGTGKTNHGIIIKLTGSQEAFSDTESSTAVLLNDTGSKRSYYTKRFFARTSEYFFKRPCIEARFDESIKDDRGNFYYSSSLAPKDDNVSHLYLYNYVRGKLADIPGISSDYKGEIYVSFFSGNLANSAATDKAGPIECVTTTGFVQSGNPYVVTGGYVSTGIYSASVCLTGASDPLTRIYDVWFTGSLVVQSSTDSDAVIFKTGSFVPNTLSSSPIYETPRYSTKITNLKTVYGSNETPRLRAFVRTIGEDYNIYTRVNAEAKNTIIEDACYKVYRLTDDLTAVSYGTGSSPGVTGSKEDYTRLSFDVSGGYFDFDMSLLEKGYGYGIKFAYYNGIEYLEQPEIFKFRIEDKS